MPSASRNAFVLALTLGSVLGTRSALAQLSADEELKTLRPAEGIVVSLFAAEPMITNPAAIDVDTRGRVWVAEIQWYRSGAKDPPADKIKVLEDADGDGRADKCTVFAEGLFAPMSICVAGPQVFVATSPDLWVFEDRDGNLVADGPPKKLLTGFGGRNHDHGAHSLALGPDHKWWMSHGDAGFDVTGIDGSRIQYRWGAVLRGELDGSHLETVAVNFRNPYEVCVSSFGEPFCSDNDNDGNQSVRICWIMEGGNYGWFGGPPFGKDELPARLPAETPYREHWHFRGHVPGFVPATLVTGFGSPTGICFYEGDVFGPKYQDTPLHTDPGPRECRVYRHQLAGFGMRATSEIFLSNQGDDYFRPDDICAAPDGRLFVSDWYDGSVGGHAYNNPDQGRIFLLSPKGKAAARREKPGPYDNVADAIEGLRSPNLATQFLARERLLAEGNGSVAALQSLVSEGRPNERARALWVLDRIGGDARQSVVQQLKSDDSTMRALAVRILRRRGAEFADALLALATDAAAEVRREVLLAIRTLPREKALAALATIAAGYDGSDRYQLEAIHIAAGDRGAQLLARLESAGPLSPAQFPLLAVLAPERASQALVEQLSAANVDDQSARSLLVQAVNIPSPAAGWALLKLASDKTKPQALRRQALETVLGNAGERGGWRAIVADEQFASTLRDLLGDAALRSTVLAAIGKLRLDALASDVLAVARDSALDDSSRAKAIGIAARLKPEGINDLLRQLSADARPAVADASLRALVDVQDIRTLRELFSLDKFSNAARQSAAERLIDTTGGAIVLLRLIEEDRLEPALRQQMIAKAVAHADANVRVLYEKFVPESERPKKLGATALAADEILALDGDANRGRVIFNKSSAAQCKQCHAVQGFGGSLGPDLTKIGKKYERKALLETIVQPSKAIAPEFIPYLLETKNGQVYAGFLVERTADHVVLKDVKSQLVRVETAEVEALLPQQKSLMPELVLSEVTAQDAADLLAFLSSLK